MSKLVALGVALVAVPALARQPETPAEQRAVTQLAELGARFNLNTGTEPDARPVKSVCFGVKEQVTDADLEPLKHLPNLRWVILVEQKRLTGECLKYLAGHAYLHTVDLDGSAVHDKHLVHLKELPRLWRLGLWRTTVTDAGMAHLKDLAKLERLYLSGTGGGDSGIEAIGRHPSLRVLEWEDTRVTVKGEAFMKANFPNYGRPAPRPPAETPAK